MTTTIDALMRAHGYHAEHNSMAGTSWYERRLPSGRYAVIYGLDEHGEACLPVEGEPACAFVCTDVDDADTITSSSQDIGSAVEMLAWVEDQS